LTEAHEPIFKAPWPPLLLAVIIVAGYGLQVAAGSDAAVAAYAFRAADLAEGRWQTLVTALFLHGGWAHALLNAASALAFGTPVARLFATDARGAAIFLAFYLVCGALASLGYGLVHPGGTELLVGASGAVSGLMGACARILAGRGVPGPYLSPVVLGMAGSWVGINLVVAVLGFAPGMGQGPVAWEAHLAGFAAGLVLIDPFTWIVRRR
jgi:membrane associated rhomboid family serine protease